MGTHVYPTYAPWVWNVLCVVGMVGTFAAIWRRSPVKTREGWRIGAFWFFLFAYGAIWLHLLRPWSGLQMNAFICTLVMFAYVMMGLFWDRYLLWLGLAVTAATLLGVHVFERWYCLWMAGAGGGALLGTGLYIRYRWQ